MEAKIPDELLEVHKELVRTRTAWEGGGDIRAMMVYAGALNEFQRAAGLWTERLIAGEDSESESDSAPDVKTDVTSEPAPDAELTPDELLEMRPADYVFTPQELVSLSGARVDWEELDRLFTLLPDGPWCTINTAGGSQVRQMDTDPTNKYHWPTTLCCTTPGQRAPFNVPAMSFVAGVLNSWPYISAAVKAAMSEAFQPPLKADWTEELDLSQDARKLCSDDPALQSLLYDLDLLPEQLLAQSEKTPGLIKAYHRLYGVLYAWQAAKKLEETRVVPLTAYCINWTELDQGWDRPDGHTLHPTMEAAQSFSREYSTPSPSGAVCRPSDIFLVPVSKDEYTQIALDRRVWGHLTQHRSGIND